MKMSARFPLALAVSAFAVAACSADLKGADTASAVATTYSLADLEDILADPVRRSEMIVKVMGSTQREDTHAFLKFHVYGYTGENLIPFFTMNNVIVQKWTPMDEPGHFALQHYEAAYYSEFDGTKPIESWTNPVTGETIRIPPFILGPISREYTPEGIIAPGLAPEPLNVSVIGDRIFIPTQSIDVAYNPMSTPDWGAYQGPEKIYWDSMMTYSAEMKDVLDPTKARAPSQIHMQNLVSFNPYFKMGMLEGRTMVRAYGMHLDSLEQIPPEVRAGLEAYVPEIFNTEEWTELRIDTIDFMQEVRAQLDAAEEAGQAETD